MLTTWNSSEHVKMTRLTGKYVSKEQGANYELYLLCKSVLLVKNNNKKPESNYNAIYFCIINLEKCESATERKKGCINLR